MIYFGRSLITYEREGDTITTRPAKWFPPGWKEITVRFGNGKVKNVRINGQINPTPERTKGEVTK